MEAEQQKTNRASTAKRRSQGPFIHDDFADLLVLLAIHQAEAIRFTTELWFFDSIEYLFGNCPALEWDGLTFPRRPGPEAAISTHRMADDKC